MSAVWISAAISSDKSGLIEYSGPGALLLGFTPPRSPEAKQTAALAMLRLLCKRHQRLAGDGGDGGDGGNGGGDGSGSGGGSGRRGGSDGGSGDAATLSVFFTHKTTIWNHLLIHISLRHCSQKPSCSVVAY